MNEDGNLTIARQQHLKQIREIIEELETRMNYKAQPLSDEEQDRLDAKFHYSSRMRRWIG